MKNSCDRYGYLWHEFTWLGGPAIKNLSRKKNVGKGENLIWPLLSKTLHFLDFFEPITTQSQPNHVSIFVHPTFTGPPNSLFFCHFLASTRHHKNQGIKKRVGLNFFPPGDSRGVTGGWCHNTTLSQPPPLPQFYAEQFLGDSYSNSGAKNHCSPQKCAKIPPVASVHDLVHHFGPRPFLPPPPSPHSSLPLTAFKATPLLHMIYYQYDAWLACYSSL